MIEQQQRFHALDALRAAALISGIVVHSAMPYILAPGAWAVGTNRPHLLVGWLVYYLHTFRLEVFFLLAGFFGAVVAGRRGQAAYLRDRVIRILLVFIVALYPMKLVLASLWIVAGRTTGWLRLPSGAEHLPWYVLGLGSLGEESWPDIALTHLWFLYILACIVGMFMAAWAIASRIVTDPRAFAGASRLLRAAVSSRAWPWLLAALVTPIVASMTGMDIDTPDKSLAWHVPVMVLYTLFFSFGWWLNGHVDLIAELAKRRKPLLALGLVASVLGATGIGLQSTDGDWVAANIATLRWATSFGTSVAMTASVFGWLGAFWHWFRVPSTRIRYIADASYWMYIAHLPIVIALETALSSSGIPWWIGIPLVTAVTAVVLLATYHWGVRYTWVGAWLNGRRRTRPATPAWLAHAE